MASSSDFFLSGDPASAQVLVGSSLTQQGFTVTTSPKGGLYAERGNKTKTFWLGGVAGKDFHMTFIVEFFTDAQGNLVARLNRNMGGGALKGGALGAAKTETVFGETSAALVQQLTASQRLVGFVENA